MTKTATRNISRRDAIKIITAAAGSAALVKIPANWSKPDIESSLLAPHAQTTTPPPPVVYTVSALACDSHNGSPTNNGFTINATYPELLNPALASGGANAVKLSTQVTGLSVVAGLTVGMSIVVTSDPGGPYVDVELRIGGDTIIGLISFPAVYNSVTDASGIALFPVVDVRRAHPGTAFNLVFTWSNGHVETRSYTSDGEIFRTT